MCGSGAPEKLGGGRSRVGHRWLASANSNAYGVKTGELCSSSVAAVPATGLVPSVVKAGCVYRATHCEPLLLSLCGCYW